MNAPTSPPANALPPAFSFSDGGKQGELCLELDGMMQALPPTGRHPRGRYTAESFQRSDPHRYALIVQGLAQGYRKNSLARALGVAWETVNAVEKREAGLSIRDEKKRFADGLAEVIELGIDGLMDKAADGKLSALDVAVLVDKHQLLRGEATSITETRGEDPAVIAYREFLRMGSEAAGKSAMAGAAGDGARLVAGTVIDSGAGASAAPVQELQPVDAQRL